MLKKTMTYTDYDGVERTQDFYFNLSKAEILEMQLSSDGGYDKLLERIVKAKDTKSLIAIFKDLILRSYGIKSDDGKRFMKSPEISAEFEQTPAYSDLFMQLATDTDAATAFVTGIIPGDLQNEVEKMNKNQLQGLTEV